MGLLDLHHSTDHLSKVISIHDWNVASLANANQSYFFIGDMITDIIHNAWISSWNLAVVVSSPDIRIQIEHLWWQWSVFIDDNDQVLSQAFNNFHSNVKHTHDMVVVSILSLPQHVSISSVNQNYIGQCCWRQGLIEHNTDHHCNVNNGSCNVLVQSGNKPLPEPMLVHITNLFHHWGIMTTTIGSICSISSSLAMEIPKSGAKPLIYTSP